MSAIEQISYTNPANYIYDDTQIEVTGGVAKLIMQQAQHEFTENFTSDSGFTYDSDIFEFVAGKLQQKNKTPTGAVFYAPYTNGANAAWSAGTPTATLGGTANVHDGLIDFTGGNAYVEYPINNFSALGQQACVRIKGWKPGYTGSAPSIQYILQSAPSSASRIYLVHNGGYIQCYIHDSGGSLLFSMTYAFSAVAGTPYEFEIDYNATTGHAYLFQDGVLQDSDTGTGTINAPTLWRIGQGSNANFTIDAVLVFSTLQHSSNYTPNWSSIYETRYLAGTVTCPETEHTDPGYLRTFDAFSTTESGSPKYILQIDRSGDYLYWGGSTWDVSNETYTQATDKTTFNTQCTNLDVDGATYGQYKILCDNSNTQSYIDVMTSTLTEDTGYPTDNPTIEWNGTFTSNELVEFTEDSTKTGNDEIKYNIKVSSIYKYYSGSTQTANGTYTQSNTAAEVESNIGEWLEYKSVVSLKAFLHSDDGYTTPELSLNTITYDITITDAVPSTLVQVEGYWYKGSITAEETQLYMRPYLHGFHTGDPWQDYSWTLMGTVAPSGWFEINQYLQPSGEYWEIKSSTSPKRYKIALPDNEGPVNWTDITKTAIEEEE